MILAEYGLHLLKTGKIHSEISIFSIVNKWSGTVCCVRLYPVVMTLFSFCSSIFTKIHLITKMIFQIHHYREWLKIIKSIISSVH